MSAMKTYGHSVMSFRLLCRLWTSVCSLQQLFCLLSLNIDLFQGGSYKLKWRCHAFLAFWLPLWTGFLIATLFFIRLALDSSNWIKICLDSSSRILESCPLVSLYPLLVTLNKSMSSVSSLPQDYILQFWYVQVFLRSTLFCFSFEYCWLSYLGIYSDCVWPIWASPAKFK